MLVDPAETLLQFFPRALLNFDVTPPGTTIGPLHAIFSQGGQALANFQNDALLASAQLSVQQAAGAYLDRHGLFYGVARRTNESDAAYRARILGGQKKLTIPAIDAALTAYYASAPYPHTVSVFDLQSNPVRAASLGLVKLDFVVDIATAIPASLLFFAGKSFVGRTTYIVAPDNAWAQRAFFAGRSAAGTTFVRSHISERTRRLFFAGRSFVGRSASYVDNLIPTLDSPIDRGVIAEVIRVKAAGTHPLYLFARTISPLHADTRTVNFFFAGRSFVGRKGYASFGRFVFPQYADLFASRSFTGRNSYVSLSS